MVQDEARFALGAVLTHETDLTGDPTPFRSLVETLVGGRSAGVLLAGLSPAGSPAGSYPDLSTQTFDLTRLMSAIRRGSLGEALIESPARTADEHRILVRAEIESNQPRGARRTRSVVVALGAQVVERVGREHALDAVLDCARSVGAETGTVFWARTAAHAIGLAAELPSSRGLGWGTIVSGMDVVRLGGLGRVRSEAGCHRIVVMPAGSVFLQLSSIEDPIVVGRDSLPVQRLQTFLASA
jgi:hypothetical protein